MLIAIVLLILGVVGMMYGYKQNQRSLLIASAAIIALVLAAWVYFYINPY